MYFWLYHIYYWEDSLSGALQRGRQWEGDCACLSVWNLGVIIFAHQRNVKTIGLFLCRKCQDSSTRDLTQELRCNGELCGRACNFVLWLICNLLQNLMWQKYSIIMMCHVVSGFVILAWHIFYWGVQEETPHWQRKIFLLTSHTEI